MRTMICFSTYSPQSSMHLWSEDWGKLNDSVKLLEFEKPLLVQAFGIIFYTNPDIANCEHCVSPLCRRGPAGQIRTLLACQFISPT